MNNKCYLSIDFEDANHDFKRQYGIDNDPPLLKEELWSVYQTIEDFCQKKLDGARLTFFCTGIIAKKMPEIIAKIAEDGHEIGCHYFQHDHANKDNLEDFETNIAEAVKYLEQASNQTCKGFRAPFFSLTHEDKEHFKILEKYFDYDSSLVVNSKEEAEKFERILNLEKLTLLPIFKEKIHWPLPSLRSGGTYLKTFRVNSMLKLINRNIEEGLAPMIYLHPYEFVSDMSFKPKFSEMKGLNPIIRIYCWAKGFQWHYFGNRSVKPKLAKIFSQFKNGGKIENLLLAK